MNDKEFDQLKAVLLEFLTKQVYPQFETVVNRVLVFAETTVVHNGALQDRINELQRQLVEAKSAMGRGHREMDDNTKKFLDVIAKSIALVVGPIHKDIVALQKRVDDLESELDQKSYFGVWDAAEKYQKGNFVTHRGSMWIALEHTTTDEPGTSDAFQLVVKRGRDGRDAR